MRYSIVVPAFNEEKNLKLILDSFKSELKNNDLEVILVDNGSTDGTAELLKNIAPNYNFLKIVRVEVNQGYGYGILSGLKFASGEFLGWTHGDLQTPIKDVITSFELISEYSNLQKNNIYIKGRRRGRRLFDVFFTFGMSIFELFCLGKWLNDINAQPNIFARSFYKTWRNPPHDFSLDLYAFYLAKKQGLKIRRMNVFFPPRQFGVSHWNTGIASKLKFIKRTIRYSLELRKNSDI